MDRHSNLDAPSLVPRSSSYLGPYGRLFRNLPPHEPRKESHEEETDRIERELFRRRPNMESGIPAAYTYLGQFIAHDVSFDPTPLQARALDHDRIDNFRTPRLDLDSVYGRGPLVEPVFYDKVGLRFVTKGHDLPRFEGHAVIADPRNDSHQIIAQLHAAFLGFHNHAVAHVLRDTALGGCRSKAHRRHSKPLARWFPQARETECTGARGCSYKARHYSDRLLEGHDAFLEAQRLTRWHYQWVVLHDYLPRLTGGKPCRTQRHILTGECDCRRKSGEKCGELYDYKVKPFLPVEFTAAVFRIGHAMVRPDYKLNAGMAPLPLFAEKVTRSLAGERRIKREHAVDWRFFLENQRAMSFGPLLAPSLLGVFVRDKQESLARADLERGHRLGLPSGQDVARALGIAPVDPGGQDPLWYYVLRESNYGTALGPVAERIIVEVLVGLLRADRESFLSKHPLWQPHLTAKGADFGLADFLDYGGVAS